MRILSSARSPHADGLAREVCLAPVLSRWRRLGAAGIAALLLAAMGTGAAAGPAQAAMAVNWHCPDGLIANNYLVLTAYDCTGSGAADVYVRVQALDETSGPSGVPAIVYCGSFQPDPDGSWDGTSCYVYSYL